jgi:hypothetical protein
MGYYNSSKPGVKRSTADQWFSKAVRLRDNHHCQECGKLGTDCAHIYGRRSKVVRWCSLNAVTLCRTCHNGYGENPLAFAALIRRLYGPEREDILMVKKRGILKDTAETQKLVSDHYRLEWHRMNNSGDRDLASFN